MQEANPLKIYFFNGLEIKRTLTCPFEPQLGDRTMLQGDFSLQVLRIGADRAGQRHSDCVSMKPKQVSERERYNQATRLFCLHNTKMPVWPDIFHPLWSQRKKTRKDHQEIIWYKGRNQGIEWGRGGLSQSPWPRKGQLNRVRSWVPTISEGFLKPIGNDPMFGIFMQEEGYWLVRSSK